MITAPVQQKVELLRRRTVSQSLATAFAIFQQIGWKLVSITAAIAGPPMLVGISVLGYWYVQQIIMATRNPFARYAMGLPTGWLVVGLLCALVGFVLLTTTIACCLHIYDSLGAEELSIRRVWQEVRSNLLVVLGQWFLLGLIVVAMAFMVAAVAQTVLAAVLLLGVYFVQGWLATTFFPLVPVRVVEHAGVGESFSRCMRLVRGHRWSNFGMIFLSSIFGYLLSMGFIAPYYILLLTAALFSKSSGGGDPTSWEGMLLMLFAAVGLYVAILYSTVTHYVHYYNLAERTDHWRLMERINALRGVQPDEVARA